ncbi:MAG: PAS-domain containing protein [Pararhodobacter sp.]
MMDNSLVFALVLVATSALTAIAALMIASALTRGTRQNPAADLGNNRLDAVFLFNNTELVDANDRGEALIRSISGSAPDDVESDDAAWQKLSRFLAGAFPDLAADLARLAQAGQISLTAVDGSGLRLLAEWLDGTARLTLCDTSAEEGSVILDRLSFRAMEDELAMLRTTTEQSPILNWRENLQGQIVWANGAYMRLLSEAHEGEVVGWPLPRLFPLGEPAVAQRVGLPCGPNGQEHWFDLTRTADEKGHLVFALPADDAYRAEKTKGEFIQTLTKTFATLPIGLAVFDRARRLQLFNPALTDLTGLEPEFLLSRPGIEGFLNRMRNKRVLPEPRDYESWAKRLTEIEKGATQSDFEETWSLPSGQTYRVSVSPHPDGALAFLIEDITSETHMAHNFRSELETGQTALDMLESGIAVFSQDGQLIMTNAAFDDIWAFEGDATLAGVSLSEAITNWRDVSTDAALWDAIEALAAPDSAAGALEGVMELGDGERFAVLASRAANGTLMVQFESLHIEDAVPVRPQQQDEGLESPTLRRSVSGRGAQVLRASA